MSLSHSLQCEIKSSAHIYVYPSTCTHTRISLAYAYTHFPVLRIHAFPCPTHTRVSLTYAYTHFPGLRLRIWSGRRQTLLPAVTPELERPRQPKPLTSAAATPSISSRESAKALTRNSPIRRSFAISTSSHLTTPRSPPRRVSVGGQFCASYFLGRMFTFCRLRST